MPCSLSNELIFPQIFSPFDVWVDRKEWERSSGRGGNGWALWAAVRTYEESATALHFLNL
jgi:hypothetical protein